MQEVHRTDVDGDSSDSDTGSAVTSGQQSSTSKDSSYRKVIGRTQSVSSTGSFVATSEWVTISLSAIQGGHCHIMPLLLFTFCSIMM